MREREDEKKRERERERWKQDSRKLHLLLVAQKKYVTLCVELTKFCDWYFECGC